MNENSSTGKIGRGLSPIAYGRYSADLKRTTEEIAYHCALRDSFSDPESQAREQRIIAIRVKHLKKLEMKLGIQEK